MISHLIKPLMTEKSLTSIRGNTFTFKVNPGASKTQIGHEVEVRFGVKVLGVTTSTKTTRAKRTGKRRLEIAPVRVKLARVTIKKGQTIPLFDTTG